MHGCRTEELSHRELVAFDALYAEGTIGFERDSRMHYLILAMMDAVRKSFSGDRKPFPDYQHFYPFEHKLASGAIAPKGRAETMASIWQSMGGR